MNPCRARRRHSLRMWTFRRTRKRARPQIHRIQRHPLRTGSQIKRRIPPSRHLKQIRRSVLTLRYQAPFQLDFERIDEAALLSSSSEAMISDLREEAPAEDTPDWDFGVDYDAPSPPAQDAMSSALSPDNGAPI